jgi:hypothetical protein
MQVLLQQMPLYSEGLLQFNRTESFQYIETKFNKHFGICDIFLEMILVLLIMEDVKAM